MTNLRAPLVAALAGLPDGYRVIGQVAGVDAVAGPTVVLYASSLRHLPNAPAGAFEVTYTVELFTGHQDPARADDALDGMLSDVLTLLWDRTDFLVDAAERTTSQDNTIHAWRLTLRGGITITKEA